MRIQTTWAAINIKMCLGFKIKAPLDCWISPKISANDGQSTRGIARNVSIDLI